MKADDRFVRPMRREKFFYLVYGLVAVMFMMQFVILFGI